MTRVNDTERQKALTHLRKMLKPGTTVYTILRHVSRSGMSRQIDVYVIRKGEPVWITAYVGNAIGRPQSMKDWQNQNGLRVNGCGTDMGFRLVYELSCALYPDGRNGTPENELDKNGGYALTQKWI